jgi:CxxC motif-containing protein (DUF1111 family)
MPQARVRALLALAASAWVLGGALAAAEPCGDVDGDGAVTDVDGVRLLAVVAGATPCPLATCDVTGDGRLTRSDAARVLRAAVGLPVALACATPGQEADPLMGGDTTVVDDSGNAFSFPAANLSNDERRDFFTGNALFNRNWATAPSSTTGVDGLGPVFNARSCSACHLHDGRGRPPAESESAVSLLVRLSIPGGDPMTGPLADPVYGLQLNNRAILGVPPEGREVITYTEVPGTFADGDGYSRRRPELAFADLAFGPLSPGAQTSARVAPHLVGLGLLAAVPEETIRAFADERDVDGDGISGRPNVVPDPATGLPTIGRFGWKANVATIAAQVSGALVGDIGITSPLDPEENCTAAQQACRDAPNGGNPEADEQKIDFLTLYSLTLAVPARRDVDDEEVRQGAGLFRRAGCAGCHLPTLTTGDFPAVPALAHQVIHAYTDLLLHDMGDGLADGRPDFAASGREWRTAPLWGLGLVETVNGHTLFLHDGRARDFSEAILWHGGEAATAREAFRAMSREERTALVRFLGSL